MDIHSTTIEYPFRLYQLNPPKKIRSACCKRCGLKRSKILSLILPHLLSSNQWLQQFVYSKVDSWILVVEQFQQISSSLPLSLLRSLINQLSVAVNILYSKGFYSTLLHKINLMTRQVFQITDDTCKF